VSLKANEACRARNVTARALYSALVHSLVHQANTVLDPSTGCASHVQSTSAHSQPAVAGSSCSQSKDISRFNRAWVGVLDIGGFESPVVNTAKDEELENPLLRGGIGGGLAALLANHADEFLQNAFIQSHVRATVQNYESDGLLLSGGLHSLFSKSESSSSTSRSLTLRSNTEDGNSIEALQSSLSLVGDPQGGMLSSLDDVCSSARPNEV